MKKSEMIDRAIKYITNKEKMGHEFAALAEESDEKMATRVFLEVFTACGMTPPPRVVDGVIVYEWEE